MQDLRYDVFYNGDLAESNCIHARHVTEEAEIHPIVRIISGKRVALFVERPWIIPCPGQDASGELRVKKTTKRNTAEERWKQISQALHEYAEGLKPDASGEPKPLASYLNSLATLGLPSEIDTLYKKGGSKFGVIDVILSTGKGLQKPQNSNFLSRPNFLSPLRLRMPSIPEPADPKTESGVHGSPSAIRLMSVSLILSQ